MIMYTTMPLELIFQENNDAFTKQSIIELDGLSLVVEAISDKECRIVRIMSTNPYDFLNEAYAPGSIIMLKPQV
ncbi:YlzJ-like family protein [Schinkia sp. CFF1]